MYNEDNVSKLNSVAWGKITSETVDTDFSNFGASEVITEEPVLDEVSLDAMPMGKFIDDEELDTMTVTLRFFERTQRNQILSRKMNPNDATGATGIPANKSNMTVWMELKIFEFDMSNEGGWDGDLDSVPGSGRHYTRCKLRLQGTREYKINEQWVGELVFTAYPDPANAGVIYNEYPELTAVDCSEDSTGFVTT